MTSKVLFPSLSEDGWVNSSQKVADYLFSQFFLSDYSQTYLYPNGISSMAWILATYQKSIADIINNIQSTLSTYFSKYFDNVVVEVTEVENTLNPSQGQISLYVGFTDSEGKTFSLGKIIQYADTKISKVIDIINS